MYILLSRNFGMLCQIFSERSVIKENATKVYKEVHIQANKLKICAPLLIYVSELP